MFRDDRDVMRWYGLCPDCGYPASNCLCCRRLRLGDNLDLIEGSEDHDGWLTDQDNDCPF